MQSSESKRLEGVERERERMSVTLSPKMWREKREMEREKRVREDQTRDADE